MKIKHCLIALPLVASVALLSACGSGDDNVTDATPPGDNTPETLEKVPASASTSSAALVAYLKTLSAMRSEDRSPLDVSNFAPPKPEDSEPEVTG